MDRFPEAIIKPSKATVTQKYDIREVTLGDGYVQRSPNGINYVRDVYDLEWENIKNVDAQLILDFLNPKQTLYAFEYVDYRTGSVVVVRQSEAATVSQEHDITVNVKVKWETEYGY